MELVSLKPVTANKRKAVLQWLLLAFLVACVFGILWANRQLRAVAHYKRLGARFYYRRSVPSWPPYRPAVEVLRRTPLFRQVVGVDLTASKVRDADLDWLEYLAELERLNLAYTSITDAGLAHLYELENLGYVDLEGTRVTRQGVAALKSARPKLQIGTRKENRLVVPHLLLPRVAASAANRLRLWSVDFSDTRDLQGKRHPTAGDADVKRALKYLEGSKQLRDLILAGTDVTDAGLRDLEKLEPLERLDLSDTGVSDAGLLHLICLRNLKELNLRGTHVTDQGVQRLERTRPELTITR